MDTIDPTLRAKSRALAEDLRREGRERDAETLLTLLKAAEGRMDSTQFLTTGQVASRVGVSRQTVVNWIKRGVIPGVRLGGRLVVPQQVMERFAPFEALLDALDEEMPPLSPEDAAEAVDKGRTGFQWRDQDE